MKVSKCRSFFFIEDFFPENVVAGFTSSAQPCDIADLANRLFPDFDGRLSLSYMNQLHGDRLRRISDPGVYDCDGLVTDKADHLLVVKTADCLPILCYDSKKKTISAIHLGWRSADKGILNSFTDCADMKFFLGVGLRQCCYQVGSDFFSKSGFRPYLEEKNGSIFFDPINFVKHYFLSRGGRPENLFDCRICSFCSAENFFSYRREKSIDRTFSFILQQ